MKLFYDEKQFFSKISVQKPGGGGGGGRRTSSECKNRGWLVVNTIRMEQLLSWKWRQFRHVFATLFSASTPSSNIVDLSGNRPL